MREVNELRGGEVRPKRFQAIETGAKHLVFVQCHPPVDPVELVYHTLSDIMKTKQHKSRYTMSLVISAHLMCVVRQ